MGSKRAMLANGLGETLQSALPKVRSFYDLFCGSGAVAGYVAQSYKNPTHSNDLQEYAIALAKAQTNSMRGVELVREVSVWAGMAKLWMSGSEYFLNAAQEICPSRRGSFDSCLVVENRRFCESLGPEFPIARAYGGYYFSAFQAMTIDALRVSIPEKLRTHGLAALIDASSSCAAAPGHTAQPFSMRENAIPHLIAAWRRNIGLRVVSVLNSFASKEIIGSGTVSCQDAVIAASYMSPDDLAFIDPPYSDVQYSRFYHVLETIASGYSGAVFGTGRYPARDLRPQSLYSLKKQADSAFRELIKIISTKGAHAIVTFPAGNASNGLSGSDVEDICSDAFNVRTRKISSTFSTLGGTEAKRSPRLGTSELILYLEPR